MRRSDREIKDFEAIVDVLQRCDTIRIGFHAEPYPYIVPLSFGYRAENGGITLYVHGAQEGCRHDLLRQNPLVCVEADLCHRFVGTGDSVTCEYESVIGFGRMELAEGEEAREGVRLLLAHCGFPDVPCSPKAFAAMTVHRIHLDSFTGKRRTV